MPAHGTPEPTMATFKSGARLDGLMFDLYVVTDSQLSRGRSDAEVARLAFEGGADVVQLRMKNADGREMLEQARLIRGYADEMCKLFIVNDRVDIAMASGADGVHLGQTDMPVEDARRIMGDDSRGRGRGRLRWSRSDFQDRHQAGRYSGPRTRGDLPGQGGRGHPRRGDRGHQPRKHPGRHKGRCGRRGRCVRGCRPGQRQCCGARAQEPDPEGEAPHPAGEPLT